MSDTSKLGQLVCPQCNLWRGDAATGPHPCPRCGYDERDRLAEEWLTARHGSEWYIGSATGVRMDDCVRRSRSPESGAKW